MGTVGGLGFPNRVISFFHQRVPHYFFLLRYFKNAVNGAHVHKKVIVVKLIHISASHAFIIFGGVEPAFETPNYFAVLVRGLRENHDFREALLYTDRKSTRLNSS